METNMNPMMGNFFAMLESPTISAAVPTESAKDGAGVFGNLLDLVSDMQVADEQGHAQMDFINEKSQKLVDPNFEALALAAKQVGMLDAKLQMGTQMTAVQQTPKPGVGRPDGELIKKLTAGETPSAESLMLNAQELDGMAKLGLLEKTQAKDDNKAESVRLWAAAIATGDLKSVSVENIPEIAAPQSVPSEFLVKPQADLSKLSAAPVKATELTKPVEFVKAAAKPAAGPFALLSRKEAPLPNAEFKAALATELPKAEPASVKTFAAALSPAPTPAPAPAQAKPLADGVTTLGVMTKSPDAKSSSDNGAQDFKSPNGEAKTLVDLKPKKAVSGSEFLLERSAASDATQAQPKTTVALKAAGDLGRHDDRRISPDALDFVADKVDALKTQGGGRLRVELNPRDLGNVEIRVTMQRGQMKVELLAEKPETMQALNNSKAELATKLDGIAPARLEVASLNHASISTRTADISSSGDLLRMRGADAKAVNNVTNLGSRAEAVNVAAETGAGTNAGGSGQRGNSFSEKSNDFMSNRDQFQQGQREERRQKSMQDWEEFSEQKKSA